MVFRVNGAASPDLSDCRVEIVGGAGWWKKVVEPNHSLVRISINP